MEALAGTLLDPEVYQALRRFLAHVSS